MACVHGIPEIEMLKNRGGIRRILIHVMTVVDLRRAAVPTAVMRDDAIALGEEVKHLGIPIVGAQRPSMMEDDGLCVLRAPILVEDFDAIVRGYSGHRLTPLERSLHVEASVSCASFGS
jgi:hypothetical protein